LGAVNYSISGAPLYAADSIGAGRIAGQALGKFAKENWPGQTPVAVILGDVSDPGSPREAVLPLPKGTAFSNQ
jgi:hypothetical protein